MKKNALICLIFTLSINLFAQLNMDDSTAQVIGYWDKNEKQSYSITTDKLKIKEGDTLSREQLSYTVDITIVDSTADSYLIDWMYRDYKINTDNELMKKVFTLAQDLKVSIRTNELGVFQEVVNWREVRDYMLKATTLLKAEMKEIPNMDKIIGHMEGIYSTKEAIEAGAVNEMQQFYSFHGAKYVYGEEYESEMKLPNLYGGEPFDAHVTVWLDELNPDDNNFILRMHQVVNPEQLTNATFEYMSKLSETMQIPLLTKEGMPEVSNNIWVASRIHGSGWVVYSIETRETKAQGYTNVEERVIEIN